MEKETSDFNKTPDANRLHIGFFGKRNAGKSSLINAVTGQMVSIVSPAAGTTTDPVNKAMELLPLGPVLLTDTPGIDDLGELGALRVKRTYEILDKTDVAVLVTDGRYAPAKEDFSLMEVFRQKDIPFMVAFTKSDLSSEKPKTELSCPAVRVSALTGDGIDAFKETLIGLAAPKKSSKKIIGHKLRPADTVILVTPIDESAPKGRLILPQVQTIRDILDAGAMALAVQPDQLADCLKSLKKPPALVICDSQVFARVNETIPAEVSLTSFSILFAEFKGILPTAVHGAKALKTLRENNRVLISEGCTHHRQCEDIGTVKLPKWIETYTGKKLNFDFTAGGAFPEDLSPYRLIVHCGGCMLNERQMQGRMEQAAAQNIPFTNYGILIAEINGILDRSLEIL